MKLVDYFSLITFTEEILDGKRHFLCSVWMNTGEILVFEKVVPLWNYYCILLQMNKMNIKARSVGNIFISSEQVLPIVKAFDYKNVLT